MGTLFRGWRRKSGVVMLSVACGIGAAWMRSSLVDDTFTISTSDDSYLQVVSAVEHLTILFSDVESCCNTPYITKFWTSREGNGQCWLWEIADLATYVDVNIPGFWIEGGQIGGGKTGIRFQSFQIPYWSFIAPPTLFACYLLLWPSPQPRKPDSTDHQAHPIKTQ